MTLKITSQDFTINTSMVEQALNALIEAYPNKIDLIYEEASTNLQFFLCNLGFHVRVWPNNTIQTISVLYNDSPKIENEDPVKTLTILSTYMSEDSYIIVNIDGKEQTFKKIIPTPVPFEINTEIVEIKDTDEIVPEVIRKKTKRVSKNHTDNKYKEI